MKQNETLKKLPGFTAEASISRVGTFRAVRANGTPATNPVRPALAAGGGSGFQCDPADLNANCVDCTDDIENIDCEECGFGGWLQCCNDPDTCEVNLRQLIDCGDPADAMYCTECGADPSSGWSCCYEPPCNVIPPGRTAPPTCVQIGGRTICVSRSGLGGGPLPVK